MQGDLTSVDVLRARPKSVRGAHRLHALAMLIVPLVGTGFAVADAVSNGVTRTNLILMATFYVITGLGITVGFHRLLAHRAYRAPKWFLVAISVAGSIAGQGPPIYWVANHRRHHRYSDKPGDPHSPFVDGQNQLHGLAGFIHAHLGWTLDHELTSTVAYTPDLLKNATLRWVNQRYFVWLMLGLAMPALLGGLITQSWYGAYTGLLWGGWVRLFFSYHFTLAINSLTHLFGSRDFDTGDYSRNSLMLALPTLGESWHNNHHACPTASSFSVRWWQVDLGGWAILFLSRLGLVHDIKRMDQDFVLRKKKGS